MTRILLRALFILLAGGAVAAALLGIQRNARALQAENRRLSGEAAALADRESAAARARDALRAELAARDAQLAEATNASSRLAATRDDSQLLQNEKLRAEIARLSEEKVRTETQLEGLRAQHQELQAAKSRADAALRDLQAALGASSNEVARLHGLDAEKTARLATRDQELANTRSELAAAKKSAADLAAARDGAEKALRELQARSGADQAELAALRSKLAELKAPDAPRPAP